MLSSLISWLKSLVTELSSEDIAQGQLREAQMQALHHEASAEHHDALATMYRARIERLSPKSEIQHKNNVKTAMFW